MYKSTGLITGENMSSLLNKLKAAGSIKAETIATSAFFAPKDLIQTSIPIINVAFSGTLDGGLVSGLTIIAGPSKHFKSNLGLVCVNAYMKKYPDSVCLFYDSEFGITPEYLSAHGIDTERVLHIPLEHIEQLKFDIIKRLSEINKGDKAIIFIDSIGNLASKKEVEDAENEKSIADMTRAKSLKSLFRIVTPHLTMKDIPCIAVNHVYEETGLFAKTIVSGGCLLPGTKLMMADGSLKNIENVAIGDSVKTLQGNKPVTHIWDPETLLEGMPDCIKITFEDGHSVSCSEGHPFLIGDEWVPAKDLKVGDDCTVLS